MMEAAPAPALEMGEAEFAFQFPVVAFDAPTQFGRVDEGFDGGVLGQGRKPIFRRLRLALGPFDEQPFERMGQFVLFKIGTCYQIGMKAHTLIWSIVAAVGAADCLLLAGTGLTISGRGAWPPFVGGLFLYGVYLLYRRRSPSIAYMSNAGAEIVIFSYLGAVLTYVAMAASPFPMADALLSQADADLGFDWLAWFNFVNASPRLHVVLALAYYSIPVQGLILFLYFSYRDPGRVQELLLATMLSICVIAPIMFLLPAIGAWSQYGIGKIEPWKAEILALRAHTLITIGEPQGIVTFPSFHTVLAVLFVNMARGSNLFFPILILNLLMAASVPTEGAHYAVDVLSGFAIAFVAVRASQFLLKRCHRNVIDLPSFSQ